MNKLDKNNLFLLFREFYSFLGAFSSFLAIFSSLDKTLQTYQISRKYIEGCHSFHFEYNCGIKKYINHSSKFPKSSLKFELAYIKAIYDLICFKQSKFT